MLLPTSQPTDAAETQGIPTVNGLRGALAAHASAALSGIGRPLEESGLRVQVYRNLHKGLWSVRGKGRVIAHRPLIILKDCVMRVQESERQRVIREGQRNVHAWVTGVPCWETDGNDLVEIGYNPYFAPTFTSRPGYEAVTSARFVVFSQEGKAYAAV